MTGLTFIWYNQADLGVLLQYRYLSFFLNKFFLQNTCPVFSEVFFQQQYAFTGRKCWILEIIQQQVFTGLANNFFLLVLKMELKY